jgi:hypothetical protein
MKVTGNLGRLGYSVQKGGSREGGYLTGKREKKKILVRKDQRQMIFLGSSRTQQ